MSRVSFLPWSQAEQEGRGEDEEGLGWAGLHDLAVALVASLRRPRLAGPLPLSLR